MKRIPTIILSLILGSSSVFSANEVKTVEQVTSYVNLSENVDYHITSTVPFTDKGSVNITNPQHAVVIFDHIKPSLAVSQLAYMKVLGVNAVNGQNCQIRIYDQGSMILPYMSDGVLTVYSEQGCKGDSCSDFGLGNTGGFMNTLTSAQLNNRIKSFRLKRGYMVTFSNLAGGYGYSRCFIADQSDLEINLPDVMSGKISSYRIFKWNDVSKKGLANNTGSAANSALNTTWCYTFSLGENTGLDRECVPFHIYEDWPSVSDCGSVNYSPNLKTNNEPANSVDDHPQSVATVLANWENLMATGMRLCAPSSHDGGLNWLEEFMDSVDARGWRVDVLDVHAYWYYDSWEWNMYNNFYQKYHRPIWVSEFLWGASWSTNWYNGDESGSISNYKKNLSHMKGILTYLNQAPYIERYAYWNDEADCSKIYNPNDSTLSGDNYLTPLGQYYADMDPGVGYDDSLQYIPKGPRMYAPSDLALSFNPTTSIVSLSWKDTNGELNDSMYVERKLAGGQWERITSVSVQEKSGAYSYNDTIFNSGTYTYRIHTITFDGKDRYSSEVNHMSNGAIALGGDDVQYGTITTSSTDYSYNYMAEPYEEEPVVVFGSMSNLNSELAPVEHLFKVFSIKGSYSFFRSNVIPWTKSEVQDFYQKDEDGNSRPDFSSYLIAKIGNGKIGSLAYEAGKIPETKIGNVVSYTFDQPFDNIPVVLATPIYTSASYPIMWRVFDVTKSGFKVKLQRQKGLDNDGIGLSSAAIDFIAIEQGQTTDGTGKRITVRADSAKFVLSTSLTKIAMFGDTLHHPTFLIQLQSLQRDVAALLRTRPLVVDSITVRARFQIDDTDENSVVNAQNPIQEKVGWIAISDDGGEISAINETTVDRQKFIYPSAVSAQCSIIDKSATRVSVYNLGGQLMLSVPMVDGNVTLDVSNLPKGIYIICTNVGHRGKFTRK